MFDRFTISNNDDDSKIQEVKVKHKINYNDSMLEILLNVNLSKDVSK